MAVFRRVYPDDTLGRHGWFVMGHPFDPPPPPAENYGPWLPNPWQDGRSDFFDPTLDKGTRQV
jgi:hypothetical protein